MTNDKFPISNQIQKSNDKFDIRILSLIGNLALVICH